MLTLALLHQVRVHSREGTLQPVTDVTLDRVGAQWPPKLSRFERADIMRPENLRSGGDRQLLSEIPAGVQRRHLLASALMRVLPHPSMLFLFHLHCKHWTWLR